MKRKKLFKRLVRGYLVYALVLSTLAYVGNPLPPKEFVDNFSLDEFFSEELSRDRVRLVEEPMDSFKTRLELLRGAEESLDISYHVIGRGKTVDYFFKELIDAANRGVQVRFLLDGKASLGMFLGSNRRISYALYNHPNIQFKLYNPLRPLRPWTWHSLLHDKFIIVDRDLALLGGRNIGDHYMNPQDYPGPLSLDWDLLVFNSSPGEASVIDDLAAYMDQLWSSRDSRPYRIHRPSKKNLGWDFIRTAGARQEEMEKFIGWDKKTRQDYMEETLAVNKVSLIRNPIHTHRKEPTLAYSLAKLAQEAETQVFIQTPYATANKHTLALLEEVGRKDLDFSMLTNSLYSSPNYPAYSNFYRNRDKFLATGLDLYEFQSQDSIHGKTYIFDDLAAIGSFNLDDRSIYIDTESMLLVHSEEFAQILKSSLDKYIGESSLRSQKGYSYNLNSQPLSRLKLALMKFTSIFSQAFQFLI